MTAAVPPPARPRFRRRRRGLALTVAAGLAALPLTFSSTATASDTGSAAALQRVPRPVLWGNFADPTVERYGAGYVGFATGELAPRAFSRSAHGPWQRSGAALTGLPSWSRRGHLWASDLSRVAGRWVLYFSAPVRGAGEYGRCIGVATSQRPLRGFRIQPGPPLVCPSKLKVPTALDPVLDQAPGLPRAGVIDPWLFRDRDGSAYLIYKTDRMPSSLRLLPLNRTGVRPKAGRTSQELLRYDGVIENPVLVRRRTTYVLLASEGDYTTCDYRTIWRQSTSLTDWGAAVEGVLLDEATTGLCGPGGADVASGPGSGTRLYLHAWTCDDQPLPCVGRLKWDHRPRRHPLRSMYAARLGWTASQTPRVVEWLAPPRQDG